MSDFLPTPNYCFPQVLKAIIILGSTCKKKKTLLFFLNHYPFHFSVTTELKTWLKSLYYFHFIVFSDNYFRKSFQDALSGKQSYRDNWYANDTILRWPIPTVFWAVLQHQVSTHGPDGASEAESFLTAAFEQVPNSSSSRAPICTGGIITWLPRRLSRIKHDICLVQPMGNTYQC